MGFRLQLQHVEVLAEFMECNPEFARGRLSVSNAKQKFKELWSQLTNQLNSVGLGVKTVERWQKTWSDYKGNLKKKAAEIKNSQQATGGGPPLLKTLTDLEIRILDVLGTTFYAGVGVEERGLNVASATISESSMQKARITTEHKDTPSDTPSTSGTQKRRNEDYTETDHDYLYFSSKAKKQKPKSSNVESAYEQTIDILKTIESSVKTASGFSMSRDVTSRSIDRGRSQSRYRLDADS